MVINHNISALNTLNKLASNTNAAQSSLEKLSSGLRINKAADDAAGLAISQKMQAQINGLDTASDNAQNGISLIQTTEGALSETQSILQRMRELAVEGSNGTNNSSDQAQLQQEADQLAKDLNRIASQTSFNTIKVLDTQTSGASSLFAASGVVKLQIGANSTEQIDISLTGAGSTAFTGVTAAALGVNGSAGTGEAATALSVSDTDNIDVIQSAIDKVSTMRAKLGAYQNRLDHAINNLSTESQNLSSAESQITDVDMASEMTNYTKNNILVQSAEAMLAQANQLPQGVLSLLK